MVSAIAERLIAAIQQLAAGEVYAPQDLLKPGAMQDALKVIGSEVLTPRELEVAVKLARGDSMQEIAARLSLSPKTVATYKYRVFEKLGVDSNVALAHLAVQHRVLDGMPV